MDSGFDTFTTTLPAIVLSLIAELERGVALLDQIGDAVYISKSETSGSVGQHFRHNLNFVEAVLNGIQLGRIDYARRIRDARIEADRAYATERFEAAILRLLHLKATDSAKEVSVVSEVNDTALYRSSVGRELEFAYSHTVHHHALIAEKLRAQGVEVDALLGVAPSTKRYWKAGFDTLPTLLEPDASDSRGSADQKIIL